MTNNFDVLIIGAGISGLVATRRLISRGILNVALLEARDRIGGRIHITKNGDDAIDLGAHFVHGTIGNAVYSFAEPLGLLMPPEEFPDQNCYISARDGQEIDEELVSSFEERFDELFEECRNNDYNSEGVATLADIFDIMKRRLFSFPNFTALSDVIKEDLFAEFVKTECVDLATSDPSEVAASGAALWRDCQNPYYSILKNGYSSLMPRIYDESVKHVVKLNTVVKKIIWSDKGCVVQCQLSDQQGYAIFLVPHFFLKWCCAFLNRKIETFSADRVICTVPLGCLKAKLIEFAPALPVAKLSAISSLGVGLLDKYMLQFDTKWWPDNVSNLVVVWPSDDEGGKCDLVIKKWLDPSLYKTEDEMSWYRHISAFDVEPAVRSGNYLVAYAAGKWAALIEQLPDEEIMRVFDALISTFLQPHFPVVEMPFRVIRSKWLMDPFAHGSYTLMAMGSTPNMLDDFAEPLPSSENPRLMFAGETAHRHFFSSVHGAWEAGEREADRIIEALKK